LEALPTIIRKMEENDKNFIFSTWLKACRYSLVAKRVPNDLYYKYQQKLIEVIFARSSSNTIILVDAEAHDSIIGYICFEKLNAMAPIIHFAYVKGTFQGHGFFKKLLQAAEIDLAQENIFTHYTIESMFSKEKREELKTELPVTAEVIKANYPKLIYCPYLV
jgi:hypothetical protein